MSNELLWLIFALTNFLMVILIYRIFGKNGLIVWIGMSTVLANMQVLKTVELFGVIATLGNILYGTIFLATDIINEKYGKAEARKAVWLGFYTLVTMTIVMQFALLFQPHESDVAHEALSDIFNLVPQVAVGSLLAYIVSQNIDVVIFAKLKEKFAGTKFLWVRNNLSTMISQLIDTTIFSVIAFWHFLTTDISVWLSIFISTYVIKFLVSALDTPFMYLAKKIHKQ
ncbi:MULTISPECIES: queuosine precursor transporter [Allobacillus]|uniref:Probable queuosine precursor transporter n=1 Tax=Allobacillus salarius TaxID=1955272 RepID=A0A556PT19_9BACI|nr:queuosine precursor transporter [Allobacillus salarius]TSJ67524.1 queuosine precursor transporter [Allobacillus salarius]